MKASGPGTRLEIRVSTGQPVDPEHLRTLVGSYSFGRYLEDWSLPDEGARDLLFEEISSLPADDDHGHVTAVSGDGRPLGILVLRRSSWDSDHFGFPVGSVDHLLTAPLGHEEAKQVALRLLQGFETWCARTGIRFASIKVPARDLPSVQAAEELAFRYVETWLFNKLDLRRGKLPATTVALRPAEPADEPTMLRWARGAFETQRFHADPNIDREAAEGLYQNWVRTAFRDPERRVVALEIDGRPVGFMDYGTRDLSRWFGLRAAAWRMAVTSPGLRGKGRGLEIWSAFFNHLREEGFDVLEGGVSLRNLHSVNLHQRFPFRNIAVFVTLHRWWL